MAAIDLTGFIATLPKPTSLQFAYPKDWNTESLNFFGALADGNIAGALGSVGYNIANRVSGEQASAAFFSKTGSQINQRNKALFKDLPFREVSFAWSIVPESKTTASNIKSFLDLMKYSSAPSLDKDGAIFRFPNIFALEIKSGAGILFKSDALACTNLTVDYTAAGHWSQHKDGFPTKINFGVEFKELTLAVKENLSPGGGDAVLV